MKMLFRIHFWI